MTPPLTSSISAAAVGTAHERKRRACRRKLAAVATQSNAIGAHRPGDVLDLLVADELQRQVELALQVVVGGARDEHAAGIAKLLQARRDIDPVTEQIVAVDNDVPEIDSDTEDNAAVARHVHLLGGDFL